MVTYKDIEQYDKNTGKKLESKRVYDFTICDFTGEKLDEYSKHVTYSINYNDMDPCFGDGEGEGWIYKSKYWQNENEIGIDPHELFGQSDYHFLTGDDGVEIFSILLWTAKKAKIEIISLDQLLRWSRALMLDKVLTEGKYKIEQFKY